MRAWSIACNFSVEIDHLVLVAPARHSSSPHRDQFAKCQPRLLGLVRSWLALHVCSATFALGPSTLAADAHGRSDFEKSGPRASTWYTQQRQNGDGPSSGQLTKSIFASAWPSHLEAVTRYTSRTSPYHTVSRGHLDYNHESAAWLELRPSSGIMEKKTGLIATWHMYSAVSSIERNISPRSPRHVLTSAHHESRRNVATLRFTWAVLCSTNSA